MSDGFERLTQDHREVEQLFARYETTRDEAIAREIAELLTLHSEAEEQVLYPELRRLVDGGDDLADESVQEHASIATLLARMQDSPPADLRDLVDAIAAQVAEHVRREESVIFPAMRESAVDADELGRRLEAAEGEAPSRSSGTVG